MFISFNIIFMVLEFSSVELNDLKDLMKLIHKDTKNEDNNSMVSFGTFNEDNENDKIITSSDHNLIRGLDNLRTTENDVLRAKSSESSQSINKELDTYENETFPHIKTEEIIDITAENSTIVVQNKNYMREEKAEIKCLEACEEAYKDVCRTDNCKYKMRQKFQKSCVTACGNQF